LSNAALLGWLRSPDDDYDHSLLYRNAATVGPLAWRVLRQDGFGGSGRVVYFRGHEAFFDRFISHDGRYDYKLTHVDRNGNESAGATATAYLDEPKVVDVTINDGAGAARSRGVSVRVSANSGDDSGNTPDEVGFVKIYEPGVNEATAPLAAYDPNKAYPYVLSSGVAGSPTPKEVAARAYSLGLRAGEPLSTIITLIDEQEAPADEIERYETFMLAWRFRGDDATPSDLNGDANYPPANLLDPCLGVKWRSADNTSAFVRLDFGAFVELRGLAILGHNFADFAGGSGSLTLTLRLTQLVDGEEVITSHDLTAQASSAMALLSLEHARIRLLTLQIDHDGDDPEAPTHFEIGRLLAIADLGVVQPRFNLADDFTWSIKEYAKLYATPSAR
jgi:hypothetical protein